MISLVKGNLFTSPARVLVNTVNTVGVMGKGIAKTFKDIYPEMFREYQKLCERGQFDIGNLWLYRTPHKWVLNFPTKRHWRNPSKPEYIQAGLEKFVAMYSQYRITSIAFPKLGCGNGGLDWDSQVRPMMEHYLKPLPLDVFIYDSHYVMESLEHEDIGAMTTWLRQEPRTLAFEEMWCDLRNALGNNSHFKTWDDSQDFELIYTEQPEIGLALRFTSNNFFARIAQAIGNMLFPKWQLRLLRPDTIFIPQDAMLDLWQNIRTYGYCYPQIMPGGLDQLSACIMPLLELLPYMKRVEFSPSLAFSGPTEFALQLFAFPATQLSPSQSYAVQAV